MDRISLSERFSRVKVVAVDSTESDTDLSDSDLFPRTSPNSFHFCDSAAKPFSGSIEENEDDDDDDDTFEMKPEWLELYEKIKRKSRALSVCMEKETEISLYDKIPQLDSSLPLKCLKKTLDQYKKQSEDSRSISDDILRDEAELTIERNETELSECDDNAEEDINSENNERLGKGIADLAAVINVERHQTEKHYQSKDKREYFTKDTDEENVKNLSRHVELRPNVKKSGPHNSGRKLELHSVKDTDTDNIISKGILEEAEIALDTVHTPFERDPQSIDRKESKHEVVKENNLQQQQSDYKATESSGADLSVKSYSEEEPVISKEAVHLERIEDVSEIEDINHVFERSKGTLKEVDKSTIFGTSRSEKTKLKDKPGGKKAEQEKCRESSKKKTSQESVGTKEKSCTTGSHSKNTSKVKALEIKPALSFPLDELLPVTQIEAKQKRKATEDTPSSAETTANQRKRHASERHDNSLPVSSGEPNYPTVPPQQINAGDIFHGTVYECTPMDGVSEENFEAGEVMNLPSSMPLNETFSCPKETHICDSSSELDSGMANLLSALQNRNQHVISMFQAALQDQIGCNLEVLASKARQNNKETLTENQTSPQFGFYAERTEKTEQGPSETGDNETSEKYDELLQLLTDQCSALVKTDDDRSKLKSVLKVLQKEGEKNFTNTGFTPPLDVEVNSLYGTKDKINETGDTQSENGDSEDSKIKVASEIELFEGRTLLKGGVPSRHIPKTTVRKAGQDQQKDPRSTTFAEKTKSMMKIPLPPFAVELYGEKKVKQMLHIDWSTVKTHSVSVNEKDPRVKTDSGIGENLKLIVDATKTLIENLQVSRENLAEESKEKQNTSKSKGKTKAPVNVKTLQKDIQDNKHKAALIKDKELEHRHIPVLITNSNQGINPGNDHTNIRSSTLHTINITKTPTGQLKQDKKAFIGIVKPLVEQTNLKETKPSVGIVKPMQVATPTMSTTGSKSGSFTSSSGSSRQSNVAKPDIEVESGEIAKVKRRQGQKEMEKPQVDAQLACKKRSTKEDVRKKAVDKDVTKKEQVNKKHTIPSHFITISDNEDGEIGDDVETGFREHCSTWKKDKQTSRYRDRSNRNYRPRHRSSSKSSVDSRISHSSKTDRGRTHYQCKEEKRYSHLDRTDRHKGSGSRERSRLRSPPNDSDGSQHYRSRHRHHTSTNERSSYRDSSDRSGAVKRHGNHGNSKRKRHKTEEYRTYSDVSLSDEDLSAEYHARYKNNQPAQDSGRNKLLQSHQATSDLTNYQPFTQKEKKIRRKSLEEQEKEKQEDMKFLEFCKQKFSGNSATGSAKPSAVHSAKFSVPTQNKAGVDRAMTESTGGLSYTDMLHLADLEEGET